MDKIIGVAFILLGLLNMYIMVVGPLLISPGLTALVIVVLFVVGIYKLM